MLLLLGFLVALALLSGAAAYVPSSVAPAVAAADRAHSGRRATLQMGCNLPRRWVVEHEGARERERERAAREREEAERAAREREEAERAARETAGAADKMEDSNIAGYGGAEHEALKKKAASKRRKSWNGSDMSETDDDMFDDDDSDEELAAPAGATPCSCCQFCGCDRAAAAPVPARRLVAACCWQEGGPG